MLSALGTTYAIRVGGKGMEHHVNKANSSQFAAPPATEFRCKAEAAVGCVCCMVFCCCIVCWSGVEVEQSGFCLELVSRWIGGSWPDWW